VKPWSAPTHREIGLLALERLPPEDRPRTDRRRAAFRAGTVAPDQRGSPGWVPPRRHVLHAGDRPGESAEGVVHLLEEWLARPGLPRDEDWWFQAGRLAHLVADLCLPLHTDGHPQEGRVHGSFERKVAGLVWEEGAYREVRPGRAPTPLGRLAAAGRQEFPDLLEDLLGGAPRPVWEERARRWRRRAVREVAARLGALDATRGEGGRGTGRPGLAYLVVVIAWGVLLRCRSGGGSLRG
jgi:hypothetical protein